jgi:peptidoglycan/xylan/chitin deacetylase (PgdA/CDA1 family)
MTATFFVITSKIGTPGFATWEQLREMKSAGMSIQSHTHSHPFLSAIAKDDVAFELRESKRLLDTMLAQDTDGISLPNGDHPRGGTLAVAQSLGYRWVATSQWGPNRNAGRDRLVRRYTVRHGTTLKEFNSLVTEPPSAFSGEGLRLAFLHRLRAIIGTARYARWRRQLMRFRRG